MMYGIQTADGSVHSIQGDKATAEGQRDRDDPTATVIEIDGAIPVALHYRSAGVSRGVHTLEPDTDKIAAHDRRKAIKAQADNAARVTALNTLRAGASAEDKVTIDALIVEASS